MLPKMRSIQPFSHSKSDDRRQSAVCYTEGEIEMSSGADLTDLSVQPFAERFRQEMVPLSNAFAYFSTLPLSEEDVRGYLEEPIAALPPTIQVLLGRVSIMLVPYLEQTPGQGQHRVAFEKPAPGREAWGAHFVSPGQATLVFAIKEQEVASHHYAFYRAVATVTADQMPSEAEGRFFGLLRGELRNNTAGEVDQLGWELKQTLRRRQSKSVRESKLFREYARQALIDTLTLYLHGICCDIDVEAGPRQLPSRYLRKRLELLYEFFPPPERYAVFPEQVSSG